MTIYDPFYDYGTNDHTETPPRRRKKKKAPEYNDLIVHPTHGRLIIIRARVIDWVTTRISQPRAERWTELTCFEQEETRRLFAQEAKYSLISGDAALFNSEWCENIDELEAHYGNGQLAIQHIQRICDVLDWL